MNENPVIAYAIALLNLVAELLRIKGLRRDDEEDE